MTSASICGSSLECLMKDVKVRDWLRCSVRTFVMAVIDLFDWGEVGGHRQSALDIVELNLQSADFGGEG